MTQSTLRLSNRQARHLWLQLQGMSSPPCGKRNSAAFAQCVESLGMVQLDSIGILCRAHHHILWSRQSAYRPQAYDLLLSRNRAVFEHFSHDAVILPISTYPYWQRQQKRKALSYQQSDWGRKTAGSEIRQEILNFIDANGPVCSRDFTVTGMNNKARRSNQAWSRPAHKQTLDYLWLTGELSVSHRKNFTKYYDLTERVIPEEQRQQRIPEKTQIDWLCTSALNRLGFASALEIQKFWEACDLAEVQAWLQRPGSGIHHVEYQDKAGNTVNAFAPDWICDMATATSDTATYSILKPSSRLRIVSPFDPIVRDRARLKRLFGFDYRIEIYTPQANRRYGYYVYPILEGDRYTGRIEVRANREQDRLDTLAWWLERGVRLTNSRLEKLTLELSRLARLAGVSKVGDLPPVSPDPD